MEQGGDCLENSGGLDLGGGPGMGNKKLQTLK